MEQLRSKRKVISAGIDELSNKLAGSISCPRCGHEFLVAEPGFDIQAGMKELKLRQSNLSEIIARIETQQKETDAAELQQTRLERQTYDGKRAEQLGTEAFQARTRCPTCHPQRGRGRLQPQAGDGRHHGTAK